MHNVYNLVCVRALALLPWVHHDTCMCEQDATNPPDLASTLAHKDDSETDDRLEKFMKTGSISTWVLLQVYQIVGGGWVS